MRSGSFSFALPLAAATLFGCATNVSIGGDGTSGEPEASASSAATAVIVIERTAAAGSETTRTEAVARFVRMRAGAVDDDALRLIGATVDFPAMGTCATGLGAMRGSSTAVASASGNGANGAAAPSPPRARAMALLDVGAITVESGGVKTNLLARQLPDVADLVSGVVYTARPTGAAGYAEAALPARGTYVVRAGGSTELDIAPFVAVATAPGDPVDLRVAGQDARTGGVTIAPSGPAELTWEQGGADDVIYVDVTSKVSGVPGVRCLFADAGRASIAATALTAFDEGTLSVHRVHREPIHAHGIEPGEMRFDFARTIPFSRR
jgi:hypothetical protein